MEVGQQVVCVDDSKGRLPQSGAPLNYGQTYTITKTKMGGLGIAVNGVSGYWYSDRFVPLQEWQESESAVEELLKEEVVEV